MPNVDREYQRVRRVLFAWQHQAPNDRLAELHCAQLMALVKVCESIRAQIKTFEMKLQGLRLERRKSDLAAKAMAQLAVWGVHAHDRHGRNSGLLRAMGYLTDTQKARPGPKRGRRATTPKAKRKGK